MTTRPGRDHGRTAVLAVLLLGPVACGGGNTTKPAPIPADGA
ncbi:hypothetical protein [Streptomyces bluensis]|nr:hypothetical protein [Streptomyces bluensis]